MCETLCRTHSPDSFNLGLNTGEAGGQTVPHVHIHVIPRTPLAELQEGRCFYCHGRLDRAVAVDHFLPWARVPNNNLENLVAAHARCNGAKRDFLPALRHVARWRSRCDDQARAGVAVASLARIHRWPTEPAATLGTARAIYGRLPSSAKLWVLGTEFEERGAGSIGL